MNAFVCRFAPVVLGVLNGFDRLVFRGSLRQLCYPLGLECFLSANHVLLKDFAPFAEDNSKRLIDASLAAAHALGREVRYLPSSHLRKEDVARQIAARDGITSGPICVLTCVEPCLSFEVFRNRDRKQLQLVSRQRKCLHLYHYFLHPVFGFMHARIQTWMPFSIQICLNGREWLARQMGIAGLDYQRRDNCFTWLSDVDKAQALFDQQLQANWPALLNGLRQDIHPLHPDILGNCPVDYFWSVHQSEWASDLMFRSRADLEAVYPRLVRHALTSADSVSVMRFLGKRAQEVPGRFHGEVVSDVGMRVEGVRIKHSVNGNSVKMYDKGSVLRVETTINEVKDFREYRAKEGEEGGKKAWRVLRRGIGGLHRRAEVSQSSNDRYQQAQAVVADTKPLQELVEELCRPVAEPGRQDGRKVRALNPLGSADATLLAAVSRPEWVVNGLRNRDLVAALYEGKVAGQEKRKRAGRATRLLRLLRAHGLLHKVPRTHRYMVSEAGRKAITAVLAARRANTDFLTSVAA